MREDPREDRSAGDARDSLELPEETHLIEPPEAPEAEECGAEPAPGEGESHGLPIDWHSLVLGLRPDKGEIAAKLESTRAWQLSGGLSRPDPTSTSVHENRVGPARAGHRKRIAFEKRDHFDGPILKGPEHPYVVTKDHFDECLR